MTDEPDLERHYERLMWLIEVYADLGSVQEIAEALGVTIHRVQRWIDRRSTTGCPLPVRELRYCNIYSIRQWKAWFALRKATGTFGKAIYPNMRRNRQP